MSDQWRQRLASLFLTDPAKAWRAQDVCRLLAVSESTLRRNLRQEHASFQLVLDDVRRLPSDAGNVNLSLAPKGSIQSMTDFGKPGYGGACPPKGHGSHRYIFTVFALDVESLALGSSATAAMVGFHLNQHALDKAHLTVVYSQ